MQRTHTWPIFRHVEERAQRMADMMDRLDVDIVAAARLNHGNAFANARTTCLLCRAARDCDRWLHGDEGGRRPEEFCGNFAFFARCSRPNRRPH